MFLTEMIWEDRYTAGEAVKKYPNDLIHFSKTQKLGVNPSGVAFKKAQELGIKTSHQPIHHDPPGLFFYPCKWLATKEASSSQYANSYPYYTVCKLKKTKNIINLGTWTLDKSIALSKRNGWYDDFERIEKNPSLLDQLRSNTDEESVKRKKRIMRKPGGFFYMCMDYLANVENKSWMSMLKGIDAMIDPGFGTIAPQEPAQTIVFNMRLLTVLAHGDNRDKIGNRYAELAKKIGADYGVAPTFKNKKAILDIIVGTKKIRITIDLYPSYYYPEISYFKDGFWTSKAERDYNPDNGDMKNREASIRQYINSALAASDPVSGKEMYWTSDKVKQLIKAIKPNASRFSENIRDGNLHIGYSGRDLFSFFMGGVISKDDTLTFKVNMDIDFKPVCEVKAEFPKNVPIPQVLQVTRKSINDQINQSEFENEQVLKFMDMYGFNIQ